MVRGSIAAPTRASSWIASCSIRRRSSSRRKPDASRLTSEEDVAGHVERVDHLQFLMDDGDAETGRVAGTVDGHGCAVEEDLTSVRPVNAGENLHQGGLAGTVLADECDDLTARHVEVHLVQSDDAGKAFGDRSHLQ